MHDIYLTGEQSTIGVDVLCAYLPYGLEFEGQGKRWEMYSISREGSAVMRDVDNVAKVEIVSNCYLGYRFKPLLVPLEELTVEYAKELGFKDTKSLRLAIAKGELNYNQFDNLCSEMYDLFGLFEDGLAVRK